MAHASTSPSFSRSSHRRGTRSSPSLTPRSWPRSASRPASSVVGARAACRHRGVPLLLSSLFAAALVTGAVVFVVWVKMVQVQAGYRIHSLQREVVELRQERSALEVEVSALRRPDRLDRVGRERLGLFPPRPDQILKLPAVPAEAGGAR